MAAEARSPRARYREQARGEIKQAALRQLAEGGTEGVTLLRIAKEIGLSGPALYRYFASRDDLLSELVSDAYDDVAAAMGQVDAGEGGRVVLHALGGAYRDWAVAQPHRYLLIQGTPVPGFVPPADTLLRARAAISPFLPVFAAGRPVDTLRPLLAELRAWLRQDSDVALWVHERTGLSATSPDAAIALAGTVLTWSQMHGTVGLEAAGQYAGMGHHAATLLSIQMELLADSFQLP